MDFVDFKTQILHFREDKLSDPKPIILTVLLIILFGLMIYNGFFKTRWEKELRMENRWRVIKSELDVPGVAVFSKESIEKQKSLLGTESRTSPVLKYDEEILSTRIRKLLQENGLELQKEDVQKKNVRSSANPWRISFTAEGNFAHVQNFLKELKVLEQPFLLSRLRLQNLQVDSRDPLLSLELELTQAIGDEVPQYFQETAL